MLLMICIICLNALLAVGVIKLTYGLWQWRNQLVRLNHDLQQAQANAGLAAPRQMGYYLTASRAQILAARLSITRWQKLVRQIYQGLRLVGIGRSLLLYQMRPRMRHSRYSRKSN